MYGYLPNTVATFFQYLGLHIFVHVGPPHMVNLIGCHFIINIFILLRTMKAVKL